MLELIEEPAQRERLSAAARLVAHDKYSRESYVRRTAQAYEWLSSTRPNGARSAALDRNMARS